jgi:hypothetical protein
LGNILGDCVPAEGKYLRRAITCTLSAIMGFDERDVLVPPPEDPARQAAREAFLRDFWPAGISSSDLRSVDVLKWLLRRLPRRLPPEEFSACLRAYLGLLRDVPQDRPEELRSPHMFRASELALYHAERARRPGAAPAATDICRVGRSLLQVVTSRSGDRILDLDAYKRVSALIERLGGR